MDGILPKPHSNIRTYQHKFVLNKRWPLPVPRVSLLDKANNDDGESDLINRYRNGKITTARKVVDGAERKSDDGLQITLPPKTINY